MEIHPSLLGQSSPDFSDLPSTPTQAFCESLHYHCLTLSKNCMQAFDLVFVSFYVSDINYCLHGYDLSSLEGISRKIWRGSPYSLLGSGRRVNCKGIASHPFSVSTLKNPLILCFYYTICWALVCHDGQNFAYGQCFFHCLFLVSITFLIDFSYPPLPIEWEQGNMITDKIVYLLSHFAIPMEFVVSFD